MSIEGLTSGGWSARCRLAARRASLASLIAAAVHGCAAAVAPQELHNARHAYTQASQGAAAHLAPAQLDTARQELERANMAFGSGADQAVVRDLAYIAERQVAIAVSAAALEQARRNVVQYEKRHDELQKQLQLETESELERIKRELEAQKLEIAREREAREARLSAERARAAALARLDEVARVKEEPRGIVITLAGTALFAAGKHALLPLAKDKLREVAQALLERGESRILVEGHTDSAGSWSDNRELSMLRAQEVRSFLISQGIPTQSIHATGVGEDRPITSNDTAEGRSINRRVEIVISPPLPKPRAD